MIWPYSINVKLRPSITSSLLAVVDACATESREIWGYPEYGRDLTAEQRKKLEEIVDIIVKSHDGGTPVAAVVITGHADTALRKPVGEREAFEIDVSKHRAKNAEQALLDAIRKRPNGNAVMARLAHEPNWVGSSDPKVPNATTLADMERNRRVVFKLSRCLLPSPIPKVMPPIPVPPLVDPEDDPNIVFAGNEFKIKMLWGESGGEIAGGALYRFVIWDVKNKRAVEYSYKALIGTVGSPVSSTAEGDWSDAFTTPRFLQVDQFGGGAKHAGGGAFSVGKFRLEIDHNPNLQPGGVFAVSLPSGFTKGAGGELGSGDLRVLAPVKVFKGGIWPNPHVPPRPQ